jgi:hypothetical protein
MVARGDRRHDIAAWFGLNQGRIKEIEDGRHGPLSIARGTELPPSGSPGIKARELRQAIERVRNRLASDSVDMSAAVQLVDRAIAQFDRNE